MSNWRQSLKNKFPKINFKKDFPLAKLSYFKVGGPAEMLAKVEDRQLIIDLVKFCNQENINLTVLGSASNVIISDQGVRGLVLLLTCKSFKVLDQTDSLVLVAAEAGIKTSKLVREAAANGAGGLEPFIGVPGTLGGAIYNNAHYHQDLIGEYIARVEVVNPKGKVYWLDQQACEFDYEQSRFQNTNEIILRAEFNLMPRAKEKSRKLIRKAMDQRIKTQPLNMPSSGCIFKNVENTQELKQKFPQFASQDYVPAGFLIDQAGLKGESQGGIEVSNKHAAFLVNQGSGTAEDIKLLIAKIKEIIKQKFNVELEEEVFFIG